MGEQSGLKYLLKKADSLDAKYLAKRGKSIFHKNKSKSKSKSKSKVNKQKRQIEGKVNRTKMSKGKSKKYNKGIMRTKNSKRK